MGQSELDLEAARAQAMVTDAAVAIVAGVDRLAAAWVLGAVARVLDAWGRLDAGARRAADAHARAAAEAARARVVGELQALFATDPRRQRATPLEIVRGLRREVTEVLRTAGVPEVERDPFDVRAFPDDVYGVVPRSLQELGEDELGAQLLAWGLGKSRLLRSRSGRDDSGDR